MEECKKYQKRHGIQAMSYSNGDEMAAKWYNSISKGLPHQGKCWQLSAAQHTAAALSNLGIMTSASNNARGVATQHSHDSS